MADTRMNETQLWKLGGALAAGAIVLLLALIPLYHAVFPAAAGKKQPIPFSHRFHTSTKKLSCLVCHPGVLRGARAEIPPLETCMLCHERIITAYPAIADLGSHYRDRKPVEWVRIAKVPDFVFFNHHMHVRNGIDCGACHGNIKSMDRIVPVHEFTMGFCVECHKKHAASRDCYTCHR